MKHSIKFKLILTMTSLLLLTILGIYMINKMFLQDYYQDYKVNAIASLYDEVDRVVEEKSLQESLELKLEQLAENSNMTINIFEVYYFNVLGKTISPFIQSRFPYPLSKKESELLIDRINKYFTGEKNNMQQKKLILQTSKYSIHKAYDARTQSNFIELFGYLSNEECIYLRSNYDEVQESVNISSRFLAYVGLLVTLIGCMVMFFVTNSFTKPILRLSHTAKAMANLDFTKRYELNRQDELGVLGDSINEMSRCLESTISDLKTANNQLQIDIQNKIEVDEMRKEFLSNVTHELKTPIALIQGYAEGLKDNITDDLESREFYCDVIIDEAMKMNTMVKKLLTLNQLEHGAENVSFERFDLVSVIRSLISASNLILQQKEITLHFEETEPVYVWADEFMIEEVITNYLSNAINHCKDPRIIEIKLIKHQEVVRVAVFNTGDSIPAEDINHIWDKFYKVDKARTREYGGNGIGLSIVKAIMQAHHQSFGVVNHNNGVEFWFECDAKS